jgi:CubicO group peptidase (beta-lactamase class C family)
MSSNDGVTAEVDPNDPVFKYLTAPPPPRSHIETRDIEAALAQLDEAAKAATAEDSSGRRWVPGLSIVVVAREHGTCHVRYCEGHGTTRIDDPTSVGPDTLFPCASLSKPVSATLLVAAGVRANPGWEHPVPQPNGHGVYHLAKSPAKETTLRQWLSHRSGLPDHAGDLIEDMNPAMMRNDLLDRVMTYQTDIEPGQFRYTNAGFTMGCIGAAVALGHADWEAFAAEEMGKLGMHRSTYAFTSAFADAAADRALPHQGQPAAPDLLSLEPTGWTWRVVDQKHERNPARQAPAGSLLSSARDLGQFLRHHLNGQFGDFPPKTPPTEDTRDRPYSLGWNLGDHSHDERFTRFGASALNAISFSHSGAFTLGAGTFLRIDPDAGVGIAILSNGEPTGVPEALAQIFFKSLYGEAPPAGRRHASVLALCRSLYLGQLYARKIANFERYHGKTVAMPDTIQQGEVFRGHSEYYDCDIVLERRGADVFLLMGKTREGDAFWRFSLQCVDPTTSTFVYETAGENEAGLSAIRLVWDGNRIVQIVDDWLNGTGPGDDEPGTGLGVIDRAN